MIALDDNDNDNDDDDDDGNDGNDDNDGNDGNDDNDGNDGNVNSMVRAVSELYQSLPSNGKPTINEFTILASIVASITTTTSTSTTSDSKIIKVITLSTGTKCAGVSTIKDDSNIGAVLSDSHAEVISRRLLVRYLYECAILMMSTSSSNDQYQSYNNCMHFPLEYIHDSTSSSKYLFRLKKSWQFHLVLSDNPCGDSSIVCNNNGTVSYTGAKLLAWQQEDEQTVGIVRAKAGRSDILARNRTVSMSCSDKICKWSCLGLQGSLLSLFIEPIHLDSVIVGLDPTISSSKSQKAALRRGLCNRIDSALNPNPISIHIVHPNLLASLANIGKWNAVKNTDNNDNNNTNNDDNNTKSDRKNKKKNRVSPSGISINWMRNIDLPSNQKATNINTSKRVKACQGGTIEVTLSITGTLQGAIKRDIGDSDLCSRICKKELSQLFLQLLTITKDIDLIKSYITNDSDDITHDNVEKHSYTWWKRKSLPYNQTKKIFLETSPFNEWIKKDITMGSFSITPSIENSNVSSKKI